MGYSFGRDEPLQEGTRRIAREQLTKALGELRAIGDDDPHRVVHSVRKRGKRVRALLKLVRPGLGSEYAPANCSVRDAGRLLSPIRDAHARLETFDALGGPDDGLAEVHTGLVRRAEEATTQVGPEDRVIVEAIDLLEGARLQIDQWSLDDDFAAPARGLRTTYRRGRDALEELEERPSPEVLHDWRKATKYLWHQTQLVAPAAPRLLDPFAAALHDLSDILGDARDLLVLIEVLEAEPEAFGGPVPVEAAVARADHRCRDLGVLALPLGSRLYAEKPKALASRLTAYWDAWRDFGD